MVVQYLAAFGSVQLTWPRVRRNLTEQHSYFRTTMNWIGWPPPMHFMASSRFLFFPFCSPPFLQSFVSSSFATTFSGLLYFYEKPRTNVILVQLAKFGFFIALRRSQHHWACGKRSCACSTRISKPGVSSWYFQHQTPAPPTPIIAQ
jgi:hypothetical protein